VPMFRFTIRELVLLTLIVAMGVGWWMDRGRMEREARMQEWELMMLLPAIEPGNPSSTGESASPLP
jgi:hypothetical protein